MPGDMESSDMFESDTSAKAVAEKTAAKPAINKYLMLFTSIMVVFLVEYYTKPPLRIRCALRINYNALYDTKR